MRPGENADEAHMSNRCLALAITRGQVPFPTTIVIEGHRKDPMLVSRAGEPGAARCSQNRGRALLHYLPKFGNRDPQYGTRRRR